MEPQQCPSCKVGTLKERKGKNGPFVGCSQYPSCRYTAPKATVNFPPSQPAENKQRAYGGGGEGSGGGAAIGDNDAAIMEFMGAGFDKLNERLDEFAKQWIVFLKEFKKKDETDTLDDKPF